jgi:hypothetical protein
VDTIQDYWLKIKLYLDRGIGEWGIALLVILLAAATFGLGRLSAFAEIKTPITIEQATTTPRTITPAGAFVASRASGWYYFPWCADAMQIKLQDAEWFRNSTDAEQAGYAPAKNCKGLTK